MDKRATVISAGSWGTALAWVLGTNGMDVMVHCVPGNLAEGINANHRNPVYFPDAVLPDTVQATASIDEALDHAQVAYMVVPTHYMREFIKADLKTWQSWSGPDKVLCNCTKGLLLDPTQRTDDWLAEILPDTSLAHLAGPNFAKEVIRGLPAAAAVAGPGAATRRVQQQLMGDNFRVYTSDDLVGMEVAGFYKNIIAIGAGAASQLGLGNNARAALVTRALAEMGRLVDYFGGQAQTLMGLAGLGDLMLTCNSELSRNFQAGILFAQGNNLEEVLGIMTQVAEGIQASKAVHLWPDEHGLSGWPDLPIANEVYRIVHEGTDPRDALLRLMRRPPKAE